MTKVRLNSSEKKVLTRAFIKTGSRKGIIFLESTSYPWLYKAVKKLERNGFVEGKTTPRSEIVSYKTGRRDYFYEFDGKLTEKGFKLAADLINKEQKIKC